MIPELDGVLTVSPSWQQLTAPSDADGAAAAVRAERELLDRLTAGGYDVMLVFTSFSQSPWPVAHLGLLAGIGTRVVHSREFAGGVATHWVTPPPDDTHHVDRSLHLLEAIGVPARGRTPTLRVPDAAYAAADELVVATLRGPGVVREPCRDRRDGASRRFALLVPGASCASRRYPAARFGAAAAGIAAAGCRCWSPAPRRRPDLVERGRAGGGHTGRPGPARHRPAGVHRPRRPGGGRARQQLRRPAPRRRGRHPGRRRPTRGPSGSATSPRGRCRPRCCRSRRPARPAGSSRCPFHLECLDVAPERLVAAALRLTAVADPAIAPSSPASRRLPVRRPRIGRPRVRQPRGGPMAARSRPRGSRDPVVPPSFRPSRPGWRAGSPTAPPACSCSATRCSTAGSPGPRAGSAGTGRSRSSSSSTATAPAAAPRTPRRTSPRSARRSTCSRCSATTASRASCAALLADAGVRTDACVIELGRTTPVKRRLVAGGQHVARYDVAPTAPPRRSTRSALADALTDALTAGERPAGRRARRRLRPRAR